MLAATALMPTSWLLPWSADFANVVSLPFTPLRHGAAVAREFLRGSASVGSSGLDPLQLEAERDDYRGRLFAERLRNEELERTLAELQRALEAGASTAWRPLSATIVGRGPGRSLGAVQLNMGARAGVTPGTVAVFRGDRLVGRVAGEVGPLGCTLVPIADESIPLVDVVITDPNAGVDADLGVRAQLEPDGQGALVGEIEAARGVGPGDDVRLADPGWAETAQGMLVGRIERVEPVPESPLRVRVTVRPEYDARRLRAVTLKIALPPGSEP